MVELHGFVAEWVVGLCRAYSTDENIDSRRPRRKRIKEGNRAMGLGDLYDDTANILGAGLEWYALPLGSEVDAEGQRSIEDGRIVFALLHALRIEDDAFGTGLEPLIKAAVAGDMQPLETYCNQPHSSSEWPSLRATVIAITTLRRAFGPLRDQLQSLLDAHLAEHQQAAQQRYEDYIRKHGRA
jgi:hypothetical protein